MIINKVKVQGNDLNLEWTPDKLDKWCKEIH